MMKRLENLLTLLRCALRFLLAGAARGGAGELSRILVVPAGKLGDVVCTTPVLRALRAEFPKAELLIEDSRGVNSALLADSGLADGYLPLKELSAAVREIRAAKIDAAVITGPSFFMLAACYLGGVPLISCPRVRGGFSPQETMTYKALSHLAHTRPFRMGEYAPRERLRLLEPLGIMTEDTKKQLGFSEAGKRAVERALADKGLAGKKFACISPAAGNKIKEWPPERFAAVADHLVERYGLPVAIIGSGADKPQVDAMLAASAHARDIKNFYGNLSLDELKALIARAALFVSVDTGPLYIAEAFGVPTLDITGPIDEHEQPPIGAFHRVVAPPERRRPQLYVLNARMYDEQEALRQVGSIDVPRALRELDALLSSLHIEAAHP